MVAMMASSSRERLARLANSAQTATDVPSKLDILQKLKLDLSLDDATLLSELLPRLFDLQSDRFSPVRKFVTQMLGDIGVEQMDLLPDIVPVLLTVLQDGTPAVARQAITCAINLFRSTLVKVAIQGLYSSELDDSVESSWAWMLKFKEKLYSIAFQPGSDGIRLLALKFVEAIILLYTPNPNGSVEPPPHDFQGKLSEFNVSWLRGGHPVLNIGDMSVEASQSLGLLLDQLRYPTVKSLSNSMILVLINSLSAIANKRPTFYGRILPVLLGLDSVSSVNKGVHISGTQHALRKAFISCLDCTHPSAAPWRDRLVGALREMKAGELPERVLNQVCRSNGSMDGWKDDSRINVDEKPFLQEEKPFVNECDAVHGNSGKKRSATEDTHDMTVNDDVSGKRLRTTPNVSEGSTKESSRDTVSQDDRPTGAPTTSREVDNGPVQQLIAMFGALVAQGEKAIGSIEILISSISADLLADVVMTNMRYLPPNCPKVEGEDELLANMSVVAGDTQVKYPASFLTNILALSSSFPQIVPLIDTHQQLASNDMKPLVEEEDNVAGTDDNSVLCPDIDLGDENVMPSTGPVAANDIVSPGTGDQIAIPSDIHDVENLDSGIPGLDSSARTDGLSETLVASSLASTDIEEASQEQVTSSDRRLPLDLVASVSADRSEEHSSKATATDVNSLVSSTATSTGLSYNFVLPKISAPVVVLDDDQRDHLQKLAFTRIIEAYKQVAVAGGAQVRSSLLAYLAVEFPLELDQWKVLQKHISADYINHEGHELTMRVLYRLFREAEEDRDFFSSTNATSVYEMFLLNVAETLRDSFPPSDKSLSRLLGEAPYLPQSVLKLLECLCSPGDFDKSEKELQSGDRVTQGLSTVWSLILLRPPTREASLKIALQSAVHLLEEVRMKAIRLVANKLYPLSSIAQQIEDFAQEKLLSVMNSEASEGMDIEESVNESQKGSELETPTNDHHSAGAVSKDTSCDTHQSGTSQSVSPQSISDAQRYMSLYFALCTKKHSLFRKIFVVYKSASKAVKQGVHRHIPILVRTMGSSTELLEIISDPPNGSENLLLQVLQTLTDGMTPSPELIHTIRKLYEAKIKDVEILIPILPFLPKDEVLLVFPNLVNLPPEKFQAALTRILQGSSHSGPVLTPAEVLIAIHGIDPEKDGIPLKKVTDACNACFVQHQIFTQQVIAKVLNQLVEQIPLPMLFMRTVLQAIGAFPALVDFIMEILSRLVSKQIWKFPKLWVGFLKCASLTKPQSFSVLLQLPPAQLENAVNRMAGLKPHLVAHASQPHVRSSIPRSLLVVLGIAPDSQAQSSQVQQFSQAQSSQAQQSSQAHSGQAQQSSQAHSGQAQQSSQVHSGQVQQSSQAHSGQAQQSSQAHSSQAHSGQAQSGQAHSGQAHSGQAQSSQAQSGQAQTGDTSNSERDAATENPRDSSGAS